MCAELSQPAKRVVGTRQILKKFASDELKLLIVADNAQPQLKDSLLSLASEKGVAVQSVRTMDELGRMCGIAVGAAAAGILK